MQIKQAEFYTTVANDDILRHLKNEFAFVGRSNVGKSSLINALTNQKRLAKTGQRAGLTKNINYFVINKGECTFVDLPGYGYHKAGKQEQDKWATTLENYLKNSTNLKCVFVLVDSRLEASENDKNMIKFLSYYQIPFFVVATKCDKLKKSELKKQQTIVAHSLALGESNIILTSSESGMGISNLLGVMGEFLKRWNFHLFLCKNLNICKR